MAPGVVNLRFMCHCLAKAVKMHLDFNPTHENFLQDLRNTDSNLEFTYNFKSDLKVTLHPQQFKTDHLLQNKSEIDIDRQVIQIQSKMDQFDFDKRILASSRIQEPEPEQINESILGEEDQFGRQDNSSDEGIHEEFSEFGDENAKIQTLRREELSANIFLKD
jgi:hypothetical protein